MPALLEAGAGADQAESPTKKSHCLEPGDSDTENVPPGRDKDFYFDDGDLIFRVENTLFKVSHLVDYVCHVINHTAQINRFALRDSHAFKGMFAVCGTGNAQSEGSDDEHPIILHGDSVGAFKALLVFLHAMFVSYAGTQYD